ncbi:PspC domain-containing protein [Alloscardovia omnicolens]|uniref:PspC domain-containing protein n=1 Tax=Alloscardovia omnicolens TaxID=419015 RepID=UPI003A5F5981
MKTNEFFHWIRRSQIVRSDQRWLGGVCAGLANRLGWDVALVRVLVVILTITGAGLFVYPLAWFLLPNMRNEILAESLIQGRGNGEVVGVLIFLIVGGLSTAITFWGLITVGLFFVLIGHAVNQAENPQNWQQTQQAGAGYGAKPYGADSYQSAQQAQQPAQNSAAQSQPMGTPVNPAYAVPNYTVPMQAPVQHVEQERIIHRREDGGAALRFFMWGAIFLSAGLTYIAGIIMNIAHNDYAAWGRLVALWGAGVTIFICLITLVLAIRGRKTAGYAWLGACGVLMCMLLGSIVGLHAYNYSGDNSDTRINLHAYRYTVHEGETIKLDKQLVKKLEKGTLFESSSKFHTPKVTLDMTNWEQVMGKHTWTKYDGTKTESACPTGKFTIGTNSVNLTIRVPRGCTYMSDGGVMGVGWLNESTDWYDKIRDDINNKYATKFRQALREKRDYLKEHNELEEYEDDYNDFDFLDNSDDDWYSEWSQFGDQLGEAGDEIRTLGDQFTDELDARLAKDIELRLNTSSLFGSIAVKEA